VVLRKTRIEKPQKLKQTKKQKQKQKQKQKPVYLFGQFCVNSLSFGDSSRWLLLASVLR
jgi:hypothetical protein